ncbi:hypothetical protein Leryth_020499 [Lithospermum erythrorhizon]|nr:hypothetical protein Leryth_020499 [Lithospermum erythrorhizon]
MASSCSYLPKHSSFQNHSISTNNVISILSFFFLIFIPIHVLPVIVSSTSYQDGATNDLFFELLKKEAVERLYELGKVSDAHGYLERTFQSPASVTASKVIGAWMEDAGLRT